MTFTTHGHHIPGTTIEDEDDKVAKARCGGSPGCQVCNLDADRAFNKG